MPKAFYELKNGSETPPGFFVFKRRDGLKSEMPYIEASVEDCAREHGVDKEEARQRVLEETYLNMPLHSREYFISRNTEALELQNPTFRYVDNHLLLPAPYRYNASLISVDGEDWLVYRRQMENSDSTVCRYSFKSGKNHVVNLPYLVPTEQFEDPRVFWHDGEIHLCICSWRKTWAYRPMMRLFRLNEEWEVEKEIELDFGGNAKGVTQKNWQFFEHEKELFFLYRSNPFEVVHLKSRKVHATKGIYWNHGEIRGGTPPVQVGNLF